MDVWSELKLENEKSSKLSKIVEKRQKRSAPALSPAIRLKTERRDELRLASVREAAGRASTQKTKSKRALRNRPSTAHRPEMESKVGMRDELEQASSVGRAAERRQSRSKNEKNAPTEIVQGGLHRR